MRNRESAAVSIPAQLIEEDGFFYWRTDLEQTAPFWKGRLVIIKLLLGFNWRIGWFSNLSQHFLSVPAMKMLMLAGVDRLDQPLTIAQMQVRFLQIYLFNSLFFFIVIRESSRWLCCRGSAIAFKRTCASPLFSSPLLPSLLLTFIYLISRRLK